MSRIFITGSADGLGQMAAQLLIKDPAASDPLVQDKFIAGCEHLSGIKFPG